MHLQENAEFGLTTSQDDPYLMMNPEKRARMRAAIKTMEHYCDTHPESPCALRHPLLLVRGGVWILLLGPSVSEGVAGFGYTVEGALRAFDAQYLLSEGRNVIRKGEESCGCLDVADDQAPALANKIMRKTGPAMNRTS